MKLTTIVTVLIIVCIVIILVVCFKKDEPSEIIDENFDKSKNNTGKKKRVHKSSYDSNHNHNHTRILEHIPENNVIITEPGGPAGFAMAKPHGSFMGFPKGQINQFRINLDEIKGMSDKDYEFLPHKYGFKYPVRIRSARDIIHPDESGTIGPNIQINDTLQLISTLDKIQQLASHDKMWEKIVIQEIPAEGTEYIISCLNGIVDKLYVVNQCTVKEISMKNMSDQNKKYLRKIIFAQHKKLKTVNGLFELGFFANQLSKPLADDTSLRYVGVTAVLEMSRDISKKDPLKLISYPYSNKKEDTK